MRKSWGISVAAVVAFLSLTACGNDDVKPADGDEGVTKVDGSSESGSPSTEVDDDLPSDDDLEKYVQALAGTDLGEKEAALSLTETDSLAHAYLLHNLHVMTAYVDSGNEFPAEVVTKVDGGWESCDGSDEEDCVTWADFEGRGGKISSLTVDGEELGSRLSIGDGTQVKAGSLGKVEFLTAYKSVQSGVLVVTMDVSSGARPVNFAAYDATYRSAEGRQSKAAGNYSPGELAPDSVATAAVVFSNAQPGGTVTVKFTSVDFMQSAIAQVKTR